MKETGATPAALAHALCDLDGRFLSVDDHFCELLRRERATILGSMIGDVTRACDWPDNARKLERLRGAGAPFVIRKFYWTGDGGVQAVENAVSRLTDGLGGHRLVAAVRPLEMPGGAGQGIALVATARRLLEHPGAPTPLDPLLDGGDIPIVLAAYILEMEGRPSLVETLCRHAGLPPATGALRVWDLVARGVLDVDGRPVSLMHSGVQLTAGWLARVEQALLQIGGITGGGTG